MRRLIVYGSCQAQQLGRILHASPAVRAEFHVTVHWVGDQARAEAAWTRDLAEADLLFVQDVPELACFPPGYWKRTRGRVLTYPFLTLSALWPFDTAHGEFDPALAAGHKQGRGLSFQFQDKLLAMMRHPIADHDERFEAYRTLHWPADPDIDAFLTALDPAQHLRRNLDALLRKDEAHGLTVGRAIAGQCGKVRVFHSVAHPTVSILARLGGELMAKVGVMLEPNCLPTDDFAKLQVPIHPLVAKRLGLEWAARQEYWNVHGNMLTFEQYYHQYIEIFG